MRLHLSLDTDLLLSFLTVTMHIAFEVAVVNTLELPLHTITNNIFRQHCRGYCGGDGRGTNGSLFTVDGIVIVIAIALFVVIAIVTVIVIVIDSLTPLTPFVPLTSLTPLTIIITIAQAPLH